MEKSDVLNFCLEETMQRDEIFWEYVFPFAGDIDRSTSNKRKQYGATTPPGLIHRFSPLEVCVLSRTNIVVVPKMFS